MILNGSHPVTRLIIEAEHLRLIHARPTLLMSSLSRLFHIIGFRKAVRAVTRQCITCKRHCVKLADQLLRQLPIQRVTPASVFTKVGVDYVDPFQVKYGLSQKPIVLKACLLVGVSGSEVCSSGTSVRPEDQSLHHCSVLIYCTMWFSITHLE